MGFTRPLTRPLTRSLTRPLVGRKYSGSTSTLDADALTYIADNEAAGASFDLSGIDADLTESNVKTYHSDLFATLKGGSGGTLGTNPYAGTNVYTKIDWAALLVGKTYSAGALVIPMKSSVGNMTNNNFVSGDWLAAGTGAGLTGDGSTASIRSGYTVGAGNDLSMSAYVTGIPIGTLRYLLGKFNSGSGFGVRVSGTGGAYQQLVHDSFPCSATKADGHILATTRSATDHELYENGSSASTSSSSLIITTSAEVYIFRLDSGGNPSDATIAFSHIGQGLTDTEAAALSWAVNAFMAKLGCNTYAVA